MKAPRTSRPGTVNALTPKTASPFSPRPFHGSRDTQPEEPRENKTGLPDGLKAGIESLSGLSLDDVKVHYNSDKPAHLNARAYAQGNDIHIASGQEKHLPHETWHVVQQKQGKVKHTLQIANGLYINDDTTLEKQANVMGSKALRIIDIQPGATRLKKLPTMVNTAPPMIFSQTLQEQGNYSRRTVHPIQLQPFDGGRPIGTDGRDREFRSTVPGRNGPRYYFRAVTDNEYKELTASGVFSRADSYQGIAPSEEYAAHYFGKNQSHHLIEFEVDEGIDLVHEFEYAGTGQKAEAGVMSMGLGTTATPAGKDKRREGGDYFMYALKAKSIRWRLVRFIGLRPPAVYRG